MFYDKTVLSNGITVLSESMHDVRSITLGVWFKVGSRDETPSEAGMSHFMEHMLFKGTEKRSALDISVEFDSMGAELNAFTSKEYTCFYARFVDTYLEQAMEVLSDMLINSQFAQNEVESERQVVIEEIARTEDAPDDYVFDVFSDEMFPTCTLGRPVLGTRAMVGSYEHDHLVAYHDKHYHTANCTIAVAGNVDHAKLVSLAEKYFANMPGGTRNVRSYQPEQRTSFFRAETKDTEQAHIVLGMEGLPAGHDDRYAGLLLDMALGGGMSSRLFQEVREKRGLAYSVYASSSGSQGVGTFAVYAGTRLENLAEVVRIIDVELRRACEEGITPEELERAKALSIGQSILSMEATRMHMLRLGRSSVVETPLLSLDQIIQRYQVVTNADIERVAQRVLSQRPTVAVISKASQDEVKGLLEGVIEL